MLQTEHSAVGEALIVTLKKNCYVGCPFPYFLLLKKQKKPIKLKTIL